MSCVEKPLVSVIVPVYNVEKYIELSIKSILNQDYNNIEIIIVNDGTQDKSIEIIQQNFMEEKRIKIIEEKNCGLAAARNFGLRCCRGDYVCFLDSDDLIAANHLSELVNLAVRNDLDIVYSGFEATYEVNRFGKDLHKGIITICQSEYALKKLLLRKPPVHCCTLLFKFQYLKENLLEFNELLKRYGEDAEFMWRAFSYTEKIGIIDQNSYKYLMRSNSIMKSDNLEKGIIFEKEFKKTTDDLKNKFTNRKMYGCDIYTLAYFRNMLGWLHSTAKNTKYKDFKRAAEKLDFKEMNKVFKKFPDKKIKLLVKLGIISPKTLYHVLKYV